MATPTFNNLSQNAPIYREGPLWISELDASHVPGTWVLTDQTAAMTIEQTVKEKDFTVDSGHVAARAEIVDKVTIDCEIITADALVRQMFSGDPVQGVDGKRYAVSLLDARYWDAALASQLYGYWMFYEALISQAQSINVGGDGTRYKFMMHCFPNLSCANASYTAPTDDCWYPTAVTDIVIPPRAFYLTDDGDVTP